MLQLHVGCGLRRIPGFIHIDSRPLGGLDYITEAGQLAMFANDSVDLLYNCHVLEHISRPCIQPTLQEWWRVLKPGGLLRTAVPDLAVAWAIYTESQDLNLILGLLYGRQDYPENTHLMGFDWLTLKRHLEQAGFINVRRYDYQQTLHKDYDDYSQAYIQGKLASLNVEADKPC